MIGLTGPLNAANPGLFEQIGELDEVLPKPPGQCGLQEWRSGGFGKPLMHWASAHAGFFGKIGEPDHSLRAFASGQAAFDVVEHR